MKCYWLKLSLGFRLIFFPGPLSWAVWVCCFQHKPISLIRLTLLLTTFHVYGAVTFYSFNLILYSIVKVGQTKDKDNKALKIGAILLLWKVVLKYIYLLFSVILQFLITLCEVSTADMTVKCLSVELRGYIPFTWIFSLDLPLEIQTQGLLFWVMG